MKLSQTHLSRYQVALRKESVDRNWQSIETPDSVSIVALRKESVDRNYEGYRDKFLEDWSLSARRAWIEICVLRRLGYHAQRRSPQGERG